MAQPSSFPVAWLLAALILESENEALSVSQEWFEGDTDNLFEGYALDLEANSNGNIYITLKEVSNGN